MKGFRDDFLSVFLLRASDPTVDAQKEVRFEARLTPLAPSWGFLGIPGLPQTRTSGTEPRLAKAIIQALNRRGTT